jgi:hypothetical protein
MFANQQSPSEVDLSFISSTIVFFQVKNRNGNEPSQCIFIEYLKFFGIVDQFDCKVRKGTSNDLAKFDIWRHRMICF